MRRLSLMIIWDIPGQRSRQLFIHPIASDSEWKPGDAERVMPSGRNPRGAAGLLGLTQINGTVPLERRALRRQPRQTEQ